MLHLRWITNIIFFFLNKDTYYSNEYLPIQNFKRVNLYVFYQKYVMRLIIYPNYKKKIFTAA